MRAVLGLTLALALAAALLAPGSAVAAQVRPDFLGVYSEDAFRMTGGVEVPTLADPRAAGAGIVRLPFNWWIFEPEAGAFTPWRYDELMRSAALAGMRVLPMLISPPAHRSSAPATGPRAPGYYPPSSNRDMAAFAGRLVRRYGPDGAFWAENPDLVPLPIRSWQVWNEPNLPSWWAPGPDPRGYAQMLRVVGAAIHRDDPGAEVVAAGVPRGASGMDPVRFVDALYDAGARGSFDTLAVHPYADTGSASIALVREVRAAMDRHGDDSPLWVTEVGWATAGGPSPFTETDAGQARELGVLLNGLVADRATLRLRGIVVFSWKDVAVPDPDRDLWLYHTGLVRLDGRPKPALAAFTGQARGLGLLDPATPGGGGGQAGVPPRGGGSAGGVGGARPGDEGGAGREDPAADGTAGETGGAGPAATRTKGPRVSVRVGRAVRDRSFRVVVVPAEGRLARVQIQVRVARRGYVTVPTPGGRRWAQVRVTAGGRYRLRARSVAGGGVRGPWAYVRTRVLER